MSNLNYLEKAKFELLLDMRSGYVLNFSDRSFQEFVLDSVGLDIYDERYMYASGSKANHLRGFWKVETNSVVAKLMEAFIEYGGIYECFNGKADLISECRKIISRLQQANPVQEAHTFTSLSDEQNFKIVIKEIQDVIEKGKFEVGLDRLHTLVVKFVRLLCEKHGITVDRKKPLHGLFGKYVKSLKSAGLIECQMTERILKSSISVLDDFNGVRNTKSLAHDNPLLNYEEALLIFNYVASLIRFLQSIENKVLKPEPTLASATATKARDISDLDELPF